MNKNFSDYLYSLGKNSYGVRQGLWSLSVFTKWLTLENIPLEQVTAKEVMGYLHYMQKRELSASSRNVHLSILHHYFDWEISIELRELHPSRHIKIKGTRRKQLHQLLTLNELEELYHKYGVDQPKEKDSNQNWFKAYELGRKRNKAILGLMIYQGLTTAECRDLELENIDLKAGKLKVLATKSSAERTLELKPWQVFELMEYQLQAREQLLSYYKTPNNAFFLSTPFGGQQTVTASKLGIWGSFKKEIRKQQPKFVNFQQLRTSVIVNWVKHYNLRQVQYMAGHYHIGSTEKYLVYQVEDLQIDIDKFHPMG